MLSPVLTAELARLNARQRKAVEHPDGPVLIVANPGTGKTQLLAARVARSTGLLEDSLASQRLNLPSGTGLVTTREPEQYNTALNLCTAGILQAPDLGGVYTAMHLSILKGRLRENINQAHTTPADKAAALAQYDHARAQALASLPGQTSNPAAPTG